MKRWAMAFVVVLTTAVFAQGRDLGGSWVLDGEKSATTADTPPALSIALTAKEFTITMRPGPKAEALTFRLDGTETEFSRGSRGKAEWKGDTLVATMTNARGATSVSFSREGAWLVQSGDDHGKPIKLYFKKAVAK